jgi:predicted lactoylglutathione lyase
MINELWINLPVKDVKRSKEFFTALGFAFSERGESEHSVCLIVGAKKISVMLFDQSVFQTFTRAGVTDTTQSSEVLFSFDAADKEEVDEMARKVKSAGGTIFSEPQDNQGWMYGFAFLDPDGHRWNMLHMDMSKMPGQ